MGKHETSVLAIVAIVTIATIGLQVDTQLTGHNTFADYATLSDYCPQPKQIDTDCFDSCSDCGEPPVNTCEEEFMDCYECGESPLNMCEPDMGCYECVMAPENNCMDQYTECSMSCPVAEYEPCWMNPDPEDMDGCHDRNQQRAEAANRQCNRIMEGCDRENEACEQAAQEAQDRHNKHCTRVSEGCMPEEADCELAAQQEQEEHNRQCQEQSDECQRQKDQCNHDHNSATNAYNDRCTAKARECTEQCCGCNEDTTECGDTCCGNGEVCNNGECEPGCPRTDADGNRVKKCGQGSGLACCIRRDSNCEIVYGQGTCMAKNGCMVKYVSVPSTNIRSAISAEAEDVGEVTRGTPVYVKSGGNRYWFEVFTDRKCTNSAGFMYFTKLVNEPPRDVGEHPAYGGGIETSDLETGGAIRG